MSLVQLQLQAIEKTQQCVDLLNKANNTNIKVNVEFPLRGICGGKAITTRTRGVVETTVHYHNHFMQKYTDDYFNNTIPHEVAHIFDQVLNKNSDHGPTWKGFMDQLGIQDAMNFHEYDFSSLPSGKWVNISCTMCGATMTVSAKYTKTIHRRFHIPCGKQSYGALKVVPPEIPSDDVHPPTVELQPGTSKKDICRNIFTSSEGATRQAILAEFMKQAGISKATASTYYQSLKSEK